MAPKRLTVSVDTFHDCDRLRQAQEALECRDLEAAKRLVTELLAKKEKEKARSVRKTVSMKKEHSRNKVMKGSKRRKPSKTPRPKS